MGIFRNFISWFSPVESKERQEELWNQTLLKSKRTEETARMKFIPPEEQYIIKVNGKYYVFGSKSEMPDDLRKSVENVENSDSAISIYTIIRNGTRETIADADKLPPEVRLMIEKKGQLDLER